MTTELKKIVYVRWRDASQHIIDTPLNEIKLQELEEVCFLHLEDDEKVILSMESDTVDTDLRLWLAIPKVNIVEKYEVTLKDLLKWLRGRAKRGTNQHKHLARGVVTVAERPVDGPDEPVVALQRGSGDEGRGKGRTRADHRSGAGVSAPTSGENLGN
jgi:hypothetical protein